MKNKLIIVLLSFVSLTSNANEKGDVVFRVGVVTVDPTSASSDNIAIPVPDLPSSNVSSMSKDSVFGGALSYMLTDSIGIEGLFSLPIEADIKVSGGIPLVTGSDSFGTVDYLPSMVLLKYYPLSNGSQFQPYIAAGINYTFFFNERTSEAINSSATGTSNVSVDNNFGYVAKMGLDYQVNDKWLLSASYIFVNLKSDASVSTANIGDIQINNIDVDFNAFLFAIGTTF
nr:OmpW family outer membrane protein [Paraglaciecola arctica]